MAACVEDECSFSEPQRVVTTNLSLLWDVNFTDRKLSGSVQLDLRILCDDVAYLVLDTSGIEVFSVCDESSGEKLDFHFAEPNKAIGTALHIKLPSRAQNKGAELRIKISYETAPSASALQWLKPPQTAGKKHPYLFSQCQAIHARSMVPCQDTPGVKAPYQAKVTVPRELVALMSAVRLGEEPCPTDASKTTYLFQQSVPIPSYLIAIVVGLLESRTIGPRSRVWSEKENVDQGAYEFAETEQMLLTAESLLGPYVWGQYDLLILPPSFPYGGMENPCLTFVTPTLLAGDRSLANVVAHEISHSWTGNLVTNCSWEHFWLNEGFTVFAERKIAGRMHGEKERHFEAIGGWKELQNAVDRFGVSSPNTHLVPRLKGVDPDDAFSTVPYEKGSTLLFYLETLVGSKEDFEAFLQSYINKYKYKSITTQQWKDYLFEYFHDKQSVFDVVDWDAWFFQPGMPPLKPDFDTTLSSCCTELCLRWCRAATSDLKSFTKDDIASLTSKQVIEVLSQLLLEPPLSREHIQAMEGTYRFGDSGNTEVVFRWFRLCIRAGYEPIIPKALDFAVKWGRLKFTRPIFRDLFKFPAARDQAIATFQQHKDEMHPITAEMISKDLQESQPTSG
ncbi:leukotriene A-4 hydrolase-like isoform X1 [Acanthaster planci]|uniref:Leukotriene A(4) hydrolase n=1 Tax=Acanthaster planci TaxID=133434 RepID=A0A8B7ZII4_ACAPL|nr:leukotriene A-4 hydrolase-like isoform X1 [Acanthaster planci]